MHNQANNKKLFYSSFRGEAEEVKRLLAAGALPDSYQDEVTSHNMMKQISRKQELFTAHFVYKADPLPLLPRSLDNQRS